MLPYCKKYDINKLIYTEEFNDVYAAIYREKCIKKWNRSWKLKLITDLSKPKLKVNKRL